MSGSSPLITATKTAPKRGGRVFIVMAESLASLHVGVRCVAQHAGRGRPGHRARGAAVHIRQQGRSRPRRARERRSASPAATACVTDGHPQFQFQIPRPEPAAPAGRTCASLVPITFATTIGTTIDTSRGLVARQPLSRPSQPHQARNSLESWPRPQAHTVLDKTPPCQNSLVLVTSQGCNPLLSCMNV